ncbi:MAG: UDP-2,4-diacetamido-2,4,6-trideoxy-beta-L-altropyranose hydrolase [Pirellulales bacterium]|nr:UDP-2,4-diacetamido-2,4,6-trideoxy-beta-L-altropyranose hydrolase [Pirellulales bacterium]
MNAGRMLIRADAGPTIGMGHWMRSIALAEGWRRAGGTARFATTNAPADFDRQITERGFAIDRLSEAGDLARDSQALLTTCETWRPHWVIVDGYQFSHDYLAAIKTAGWRLALIDDLSRAAHALADVVVNQNLGAAPVENPAARTAQLCGTRFALLRREFRNRAVRWPGADDCQQILVTMGGADPPNFSAAVLSALESFDEALQVVVVAGPANPHRELLAQQASGSRHAVRVITSPDNLPELMRASRLAISAAGSTCWELAAIGTPMIVVSLAENQDANGCQLAMHGAAIQLGRCDAVQAQEIASAVRGLLSDPARLNAMSEKGRQLVDGRGADRVVADLLTRTVHLRRARFEDARLVHQWSNEPEVRAVSFRQDAIDWSEHVGWFHRQLAADTPLFWIASDGHGVPVGQIRFHWQEGAAVVSLTVARARRGHGIARQMLMQATHEVFRATGCGRIVAWVKPDNHPSLRLFNAMRYRNCGCLSNAGEPAFRFELDRESEGAATSTTVAAGA